MQNLKFIFKNLKGLKRIYLCSILLCILSAFSGLFEPILIKTSIDFSLNKSAILSFAGQKIHHFVEHENFSSSLFMISLMLLVISIATATTSFFKGLLSAKPAQEFGFRLRNKIYSHIQKVPLHVLEKHINGDLIQRATQDVATIITFLESNAVEVFRVFLMITIAALMMFSLNFELALVSFSLLPVILVFSFVFFARIGKIFKSFDETEAELTSFLSEYVGNIRAFKSFSRQEYEYEKFEMRSKTIQIQGNKLINWFALYWPISSFVCLTQMLIIIVKGSYLAIDGSISVGTLAAFLGLSGLVQFPIQQLGKILSDCSMAIVSAGRIKEILEMPTENDDQGLKHTVCGNITFEDVGFSYIDGMEAVKNISFSVKSGERIGVIGPSGSGKTTLTNLILRLYDYQTGSIKLDGVELCTLDKGCVRKNIGIVLQDAFTFSKSVRSNMLMAKPDALTHEIESAAQASCFTEVVLGLPSQYETSLGEKGVNLSGGQRQRLSIAQALIGNYPVFILDDATSALDMSTEKDLQKKMNTVMQGKTAFVISHRISAIKECDRIIVMDMGAITGIGTHQELIKTNSYYEKLCMLQSSDFDDNRRNKKWMTGNIKSSQEASIQFSG